MLPSLADLEAFKQWPGVNVPAGKDESAQAVLDAASAIVRSEAGQDWVSDGSPQTLSDDLPDIVPVIVVTMSARVWNNPNGFIQRSTGPFSGSYAQWAALGLVLTDQEKAQLVPASGAKRPGLWTLSTTRGDIPDTKSVVCGYGQVAAEYLPVDPQGKDMPWLADADLPYP